MSYSKQVTTAHTSDPTVNDDSGDGYYAGSIWINESTGRMFVCTDASSGAAVWSEQRTQNDSEGYSWVTSGDGGTATSGSRFTCTLNTTNYTDADGVLSRSGNEFTLTANDKHPLGSLCIISFVVFGYRVEAHHPRIYRTAPTTGRWYGQTCYASDNATAQQTISRILTSIYDQTFRIENRVKTTKTTNGQGLDSQSDEDNIYVLVDVELL